MIFRYAFLKPVRAQGAEGWNAPILAEPCLGIEVTEPELARRCSLGNIDPQHLGGQPDRAAIEAAVSAPVPPPGSWLVTIRPDADAFGAMAMLTLRAMQRRLSSDALDRVHLIGAADRFDCGPWPGPRRLPVSLEDIDEVSRGAQGSGALHAAIASRTLPIEDAVALVAHWIETGEPPSSWLARTDTAASELLAALRSGDVRIEAVPATAVAIVTGRATGALRLAYRVAPVVIAIASSATGAGRIRTINIAQYDLSWVDLLATAQDLCKHEPGWGGSPGIIGSPQGAVCTAGIDLCLWTLRHHRLRCLMPDGTGGRQQ